MVAKLHILQNYVGVPHHEDGKCPKRTINRNSFVENFCVNRIDCIHWILFLQLRILLQNMRDPIVSSTQNLELTQALIIQHLSLDIHIPRVRLPNFQHKFPALHHTPDGQCSLNTISMCHLSYELLLRFFYFKNDNGMKKSASKVDGALSASAIVFPWAYSHHQLSPANTCRH